MDANENGVTEKICSKCGSKNSGTDRFCVYCGEPLNTAADYTKDAANYTQQTAQSGANANGSQQSADTYNAQYAYTPDTGSAKEPVTETDKRYRRLTIIAAVLGGVILILAGILVFVLIGRGSSESPQTNAVSTEAATEDAKETSKPTTKPTADPTPRPTSAPSSDTDDSSLPIGRTSGTTYENEYFGFGMKLDGWTFLSREQANSLYNMSSSLITDNMTNDAMKKAFESLDKFIDAYANAPGSTNNINIMISKQQSSGLTDEKAYLNLVLSSSKLYYEQAGIDVSSSKIDDVAIAGKNKAAIIIQYNMFGVDCCSVQFLFPKPDYTAIVTVTAISLSDAMDICKKIYTL